MLEGVKEDFHQVVRRRIPYHTFHVFLEIVWVSQFDVPPTVLSNSLTMNSLETENPF